MLYKSARKVACPWEARAGRPPVDYLQTKSFFLTKAACGQCHGCVDAV